jgi:hypothetical protein
VTFDEVIGVVFWRGIGDVQPSGYKQYQQEDLEGGFHVRVQARG